MRISARGIDFKELNELVKATEGNVEINDCFGLRYIGAGLKDRTIVINGTPGNALGAYLNGADITVNGSAQDAVGNTMNDGQIIVYGNAGDALGYAMRGGVIFVRDGSGYRTGIHMKEYREKKPTIVIGRRAGSFLGEYMAGGLIVVLGIGQTDVPVGDFTGTGMHGGKIFIRTNAEISDLPAQVTCNVASPEDLEEIRDSVIRYAELFAVDARPLLDSRYLLLTPNAKNPYRQLYAAC